MDERVWHQRGQGFFPSTRAFEHEHLPPGAYHFRTSMAGWFLERTEDRFRFPYKVYGNQAPIVERVKRAWQLVEGNVGVLFDGLQGTGKTVAAQLIANWIIEQGHPVLVVSEPVPLGDILKAVDQPMLVVFDEFEKTHDADDQKKLLSALDGMARNQFKRMYLFTTNVPEIHDTLMDRPSRIRYRWSFGDLSDDVFDEIIDDLLEPSLVGFKPSIVRYLKTRRVRSIDVVKTVVHEVNIFRESADTFEGILNLSERIPAAFRLEIWRDGVWRTLTDRFSPGSYQERKRLVSLLATTDDQHDAHGFSHHFFDSFDPFRLDTISKTDEANVWLCRIQVPIRLTWCGEVPKLRFASWLPRSVWLDKKPEGWTIPEWASRADSRNGPEGEDEQRFYQWQHTDTEFGTSHPASFRLRITPNYSLSKTSLFSAY